MGTGKGYWFRVLAHSAETFSISEELLYNLPDNFKVNGPVVKKAHQFDKNPFSRPRRLER